MLPSPSATRRRGRGHRPSGPTLISSSFALTDGLALGCTLNLTN
jgi:hypothetical protein